MGSPMGVVVWEWLNIGGSWHAFTAAMSDNIDAQFISWGNGMGGTGAGASIVQLGNLDPSFKDSVLDFQKSIQVNPTGSGRARLYGKTQDVRRSVYPMNSPPAIGIEWQWSGDTPGQWVPYNVSISVLLEDANNQGVQQIDLSRAPDPLFYAIDFVTRCQINHSTRFTRQIQRVQTAWKYTQTAPLSPTYTTGLAQTIVNPLQAPGLFHGFGSGAFTFGPPSASMTPMGGMNPMGGMSFPYPLFSASGQFLGVPGPSGFPGPPLGFGGFNAVSMNLNMGNAPSNFGAFMANGFPNSATGGGAASSKSYSLRSGSRHQQQQQQPLAPGLSVPMLFPANMPPGSSTKTSFSLTKAGARSKNGGSGTSRKKAKTEQPIAISNEDCPIGGVNSLNSYLIPVDKPPAGEDCCICCDTLTESSGYDAGSSESNVVQLIKCKHTFHRACVTAMVENGTKDGSLQCPTCKHIYGVKCGLCPDGFMQYSTDQSSLQGYPNCGTIRVLYMIQPGKQGAGHPNPGKPYNARGFPRQGFLPDNDEGRKVLKLLITAWKRRLTFTVGTSVTTGEPDTVVWNEIHHKTDTQNTHGHGYPDANYLTNVTAELASQGVVHEEDDDE